MGIVPAQLRLDQAIFGDGAGKSLFEGGTVLRMHYLMVMTWRKAVAKHGSAFCAQAA
jgi:hypothetical protein